MSRHKLYRCVSGVIPLTLAASAGHADCHAADSRPDIILFMVDDMGWQDTSEPFWRDSTHYNKAFETPNMERLARQGVKFTSAYACSISSPSRCSLITGANNARHRVTNWTLQRDVSTDEKVDGITLPEWNLNGVSQVEDTPHTYVGRSFVDLLRQSGYHTIHCGKAHFGSIDTPGENPAHWGFEVNIAGHAGGGLATYLSEKNYGHNPDGTPYSLLAVPGLERYWGTGTFATEALTQEAIKALDKARKYNQPYFDMASVRAETDSLKPVDGVSFVPLLKGEKPADKNRGLIWNFPNVWGNNGPGINLNCAIRRGDWKLIYDYATGRKELYNVAEDISETNDLSRKYPDRVKFLSSRLGERLREMNAQRPSFTATGRPCPWPDEPFAR